MYGEVDFDGIDLSKEPPIKEPQRQYYFIAVARKYVKELSEKLGRPLFSNCVTFGCQMNARDSEKLMGILEACGFVKTDSEEADLVLYNTCTIRDNANQRVYGRLGHLNRLKQKNPHMLIGLCGCMMQEEQVVEKIKKSYRFVDLIFGTHNIFKLAELIVERMDSLRRSQKGMVVDVWKKAQEIVEELPAERKYPFKSGVNIMFGCNNYCSYCIVPYVRGKERSRSPEDIVDEVRRLVTDGVVEIMLLGQNVNSYGKNLNKPVTFARLLREVAAVDGLKRIRFMTSHPKDLSVELIEAMKSSGKICHHLHLPLQSGSNRVLKAMRRSYTKERYLDLVDRLRTAIPDISLTTDIIVGFPGETEADFMETMAVVERVGFDSAFTFIYSKRTGTPAAAMEGQVPAAVIKDRFDRLLNRVQAISSHVCGRDCHTVKEVLVEGVDDHTKGFITGRLDNNMIVHFKGTDSLIGQIVPVYLEEAKGFYYMGSLYA